MLRTYELLGSEKDLAGVSAGLRSESLKEFKRNSDDPDFFIVVGGDGTILLDEVKSRITEGKPVLHVHHREGSTATNQKKSLGFTADVTLANLETALKDISRDRYHLETEKLLDCYINSELRCSAINEIAIKPPPEKLFSTILFKAEVVKQDNRKELLPSTKCDSLIFATKRGATGWNVSLGGPINLDADCVTISMAGAPIMQKHYVYDSRDKVCVQIFSGAALSSDSRSPAIMISPEDKIEIVGSKKRILFIRTESTFEPLLDKVRRQNIYNLTGISSKVL